jgi:thiosulfate reductase/polysulfide reductase chain A
MSRASVGSRVSRRGFLQGAATIGAAAALAPSLGCARFLRRGNQAKEPAREVATACEVCPNKCAVLAVVEDGRIRKLNPNPASPKSRGMLCARGNAAVKSVYDPDRVKQPLIRAGARGEGKWRAASWDEAFDFAAERLQAIKDTHGPEAVIFSSTEGFQEEFFRNFGLAFGSPNILRHPTLCLASVNLAYSMTFGTVPSFDLLNADYVIMSGANRFESIITPDTMDLVESTMNRKAKLVYLDPRFTVTAAKADEWYPIRPGTDLAFILALLHVILGEERYDREFVAERCLGIDELRAHIAPYTPQWAEAETEIPAADIARIARELADAAPRAVYYAGRRSSWYSNDFQMRRAQAILNAVIGSWDREGGIVPNSKIALGELLFLPWDDPVAARVDEIDTRFPLAAKGDGVFLQARENVLAGTPYPVKGWMVYKQDPVNALPDRARTLRMLEGLDFVGVVDTQLSDTAWYADVVFPESTYLERLDPLHMLPGIWPVVVMRQQVVPPIHDTKPNLEIMQGLATRLGLADYFDFTIEDWVEAQAEELPVDSPLEYLKEHGVFAAEGAPFYGSTRSPEHRFLTKSGKIELYSQRLADAGHDPLPVYSAPAQPPPGAFRMVLGRKATHTHAATTNNEWLAELDGANDLWLNPQPAAELGIASGDLVEVSSDAGTVRLPARVTEEIRPDCVFMLHGFGKLSRALRRAVGGASDADVLTTAMDRVSGNAAFHETFVRVRRVEVNRA